MAPTAAQLDDELGFFGMAGYGATGFGGGNAGMGAFAAENWTDTEQGTGLFLRPHRSGQPKPESTLATSLAGTSALERFTRGPGDHGQLQVFGDIRMGTPARMAV